MNDDSYVVDDLIEMLFDVGVRNSHGVDAVALQLTITPLVEGTITLAPVPFVVVNLEDERQVGPIKVDPDGSSIVEHELVLSHGNWQTGSPDGALDPELEVGVGSAAVGAEVVE